jgi:hypothetical protein
MSLADLSKRNIDLSLNIPCQEFSNSLTGLSFVDHVEYLL